MTRRTFLWILLVSFDMIFLVPSALADKAGYDPGGRRDPFVPLVTLTTKESTGLMGVESLEDLHLEGVVFDPKNGSMVVANNVVLKEGETNGPVKVLKIKADGAYFSINGIEGFKPSYEEKPQGSSKSSSKKERK